MTESGNPSDRAVVRRRDKLHQFTAFGLIDIRDPGWLHQEENHHIDHPGEIADKCLTQLQLAVAS